MAVVIINTADDALNPAYLHPIFEYIFENVEYGITRLFQLRLVSRKWNKMLTDFLRDHTLQFFEKLIIRGSINPDDRTNILKWIHEIKLPDLPIPHMVAQILSNVYTNARRIISAAYGDEYKLQYRIIKELLLLPEYSADISVDNKVLDKKIANLFMDYTFNNFNDSDQSAGDEFAECIEQYLPQFTRAHRAFSSHYPPYNKALQYIMFRAIYSSTNKANAPNIIATFCYRDMEILKSFARNILSRVCCFSKNISATEFQMFADAARLIEKSTPPQA
ncbi:MAG: hypothetical protein M0R33_13810 [Methylomonas sp.]|jgi:hypothetical protein|uniref:hypothetical protein n=1 Tax=Methylomonas sp. TaxID=418 RepID=UPI0025D12DAA|nr:hypothetical protein [Methylomonas sp.]MCK9607511.1 hypothetical protein [Methylomonas sp.]